MNDTRGFAKWLKNNIKEAEAILEQYPNDVHTKEVLKANRNLYKVFGNEEEERSSL